MSLNVRNFSCLIAAWLPYWCCILAGHVFVSHGNAQEASQPLTPIAEVNRALTDPSRTNPVAMRFQGSVIFTSRVGDFCLQDGESGVMVEPADPSLRPALGDVVEVEAPIAYYAVDTKDPQFFLKSTSARRLRAGALPDPIKTGLAPALNGTTAGRWVEVEGVVMQAALQNGVVMLHLTDRTGWAVVNVHEWKPGVSMRDWWGARLRIRCANVGRGHSALRVSSTDQITVMTPGTTDLFAAPEADFDKLKAGSNGPERLKVTATVLAQEGDVVYLRSAQGTALRASFLRPFHEDTGAASPVELLPPAVPKTFSPGDRFELVGSPLVVTPFVQMSFSAFRQLGPGTLPPAMNANGRNPALLNCDLVTLTGTLIKQEASTLTLACNGSTVEVEMPDVSGSHNSVPEYQKDALLEVTGLLLPSENGSPIKLRLSHLQALKIVPPTSSVRRHLTPLALRWIMVLGLGLVVALGGAWLLQIQVNMRTKALAVANATLRDEVAERQKAESALAQSLAHERELGELKSRFVTMVSHEFRTPLGIIMSAIELIRHYDDRLPLEKRQELQQDIFGSTRHMAGLMEQMLVLGKVEAGKLACKTTACDIEILAGKLTDECLSATNRKCPIIWRSEGDLRNAQADESLLRHIFSNLIHNAVKYSTEGGTVEFSVRREGDVAVFKVTDHGIGIPKEDQAGLFEAFQRGSNVGEIPGTGLGLVIVKRCVELHGGTLHLESEAGQGTTFTVNLPLFAG